MTDRFTDFRHLEQAIAPHDPAEIHGILCGMLCLESNLDSEHWLSCIADPMIITAAAREQLRELFSVTVSQVNDAELSFFPLLPEDEADVPLSYRTEALGHWCQGFLAGLGLAGLDKEQAFAAEVDEFLRDLVEISKVDPDLDEAEEEQSEQAYTEIVEYVRMGVLLINHTLQSTRPAHPSPVH